MTTTNTTVGQRVQRADKVDFVHSLLKAGGGEFLVADLLKAAGTQRRMRSALFLASKAGIELTAIRPEGARKVIKYKQTSTTTKSASATKKAAAPAKKPAAKKAAAPAKKPAAKKAAAPAKKAAAPAEAPQPTAQAEVHQMQNGTTASAV